MRNKKRTASVLAAIAQHNPNLRDDVRIALRMLRVAEATPYEGVLEMIRQFTWTASKDPRQQIHEAVEEALFKEFRVRANTNPPLGIIYQDDDRRHVIEALRGGRSPDALLQDEAFLRTLDSYQFTISFAADEQALAVGDTIFENDDWPDGGPEYKRVAKVLENVGKRIPAILDLKKYLEVVSVHVDQYLEIHAKLRLPSIDVPGVLASNPNVQAEIAAEIVASAEVDLTRCLNTYQAEATNHLGTTPNVYLDNTQDKNRYRDAQAAAHALIEDGQKVTLNLFSQFQAGDVDLLEDARASYLSRLESVRCPSDVIELGKPSASPGPVNFSEITGLTHQQVLITIPITRKKG